MTQHPTSIHCPPHLCSILCELPAHLGVSQTPHSAFSSVPNIFSSPSSQKKKLSFRRCSPNDITLLQCCTVHERCQSFPLIQSICPLATWLSLCSRHHGVTTCIHLYRAVITQMDVCTRSRGAFQRLPALRDAARFPATSRPDRHRPHCFVEGADRAIHA